MLDITKLEQRVPRIRDAIARRAYGMREWVEGTLDLAIELAGARDEHDGDTEFGRWLDDRFGDKAPKKNERAILIRWGREPWRVRQILEHHESRSVRVIDIAVQATPEPRYPNVGIAEESEAPSEPELQIPSPEFKAAVDLEKQRMSREPSTTAIPLKLDLGQAEQISEKQLQRAREQQERERQRILQQERERAEKERRRQAEEAERARKRTEEIARERERLEAKYQQSRAAGGTFDAMDFIKAMRSGQYPLTIDEYKLIAKCLHPDVTPSADVKTSAMTIWNTKKEVLTGIK
jgi:hypothetical protein